MNKALLAGGVVLAGLLVPVAVPRAQVSASSGVDRGKYLVEEVARCQECHTPKLESGEFDRANWLKGATLAYAPSAPIQGWHQKSPDITKTSALWQRWGDDGLTKFLETAKNPRGGKAGAPMPAYTMSHEDAAAVVAYLKTLP